MACLFLFTICVPAFGAEEDSKGLEQAILEAKNVIKVRISIAISHIIPSERETMDGKVEYGVLIGRRRKESRIRICLNW